MVWSEGNMSLKNPVTSPGIDPGTVRLVTQRLNHYATPGPFVFKWLKQIIGGFNHKVQFVDILIDVVGVHFKNIVQNCADKCV